MYHSAPGGLALYAHLVGAAVVIMPKFDPEQALRAMTASQKGEPFDCVQSSAARSALSCGATWRMS